MEFYSVIIFVFTLVTFTFKMTLGAAASHLPYIPQSLGAIGKEGSKYMGTAISYLIKWCTNEHVRR